MLKTPFRSTFWRGAGKVVGTVLGKVFTDPVDTTAETPPEAPKYPIEIPPVTVAMEPFRVPLPGDFPDTFGIYEGGRMMVAQIEQALKKQGVPISEVTRINLAYPHKDPTLYPGHYDNAKNTISNLQHVLDDAAPKHIQFYVVDEMVETVRLGRSEDQSSIHALTARQVYKIADDPQKEKPFNFKNPETGKGEFFLVVDGFVEQGTTLANLASYITLQGGTVLGAVTQNVQRMVQKNTASGIERSLIGERFRDPAMNTGRLVQLAEAFSKSAARDKMDLSAEKCLDIFEGRLNLFGSTVLSLTDGECQRLIDTLEGRHYGSSDTFKHMIDKMDAKLKSYEKKENFAKVEQRIKNALRL